MSTAELASGVRAGQVETPRLRHHVLSSGDGDGPLIVFVHGNLSTARFFEEILAALPAGLRGAAADMRGFGHSQTAPVDATRGVRDFSDDLAELVASPELAAAGKVHLVGWSLGGGVVMQYAIDHPARVASVTLLSAMSPYGFGGTRDAAGTLCFADAAGSGAGGVAPGLIEALKAGDTGEENSFAPRPTIRSLYLKPPFRLPAGREDLLVAEILLTALGDDNYPGDARSSPNWPNVAPGTRGVNNAISPRYCNLAAFAQAARQIPVLYVRGDSDAIVSDQSMVDFGQLGTLGAVPGWPGEQFPPQPMVTQLRAVLSQAAAGGGMVREEVFAGCGHSPHLEQPARVRDLLVDFVAAAT
ncbi:MAG TPA: alpha/beta hydrolase [Streptosporangiaceae bacterium]|jgi:pimeloyl-ACP methyl ester carboxylesterase